MPAPLVSSYMQLVCAVVFRVAGSSWARVLLLGSCVSFCVSSVFLLCFVWVVHGRGDGTQKWHVGCCVRFALRCGGDRNG